MEMEAPLLSISDSKTEAELRISGGLMSKAVDRRFRTAGGTMRVVRNIMT
ncbi:MAG: hypothetical protein NZ572_03480 [Thermoflexus sp.]|nr:hypothetical protein [Thermoflexus sp.]